MDEVNRSDRPNWIQQHAVYQDLMHLDVGDSAQVYAAFLVYMDLTEGEEMAAVVGVSCPEPQAVLLEDREKEGEPAQMIYPLPSHKSITHRELRSILDRGAPMLLCAVASDSMDIQGRRQHRKRRLQT
uniref:TSEN15 tRNA splicing endonuclease subunit n=1 Tax=Cyprinus carpio TaxID=7962 RepID=A0A8C1Z226_CYPCA